MTNANKLVCIGVVAAVLFVGVLTYNTTPTPGEDLFAVPGKEAIPAMKYKVGSELTAYEFTPLGSPDMTCIWMHQAMSCFFKYEGK